MKTHFKKSTVNATLYINLALFCILTLTLIFMPYFISFKKRGKIKPFYMLLIKYSRIEKILKVVILKYYITPCRKFRKYRKI